MPDQFAITRRCEYPRLAASLAYFAAIDAGNDRPHYQQAEPCTTPPTRFATVSPGGSAGTHYSPLCGPHDEAAKDLPGYLWSEALVGEVAA